MTESEVEKEVVRQIAVMREGAVDFYGEEDLAATLRRRILEGRPLRVKLGMDPSSPDLHLGHTVVLMKLRRFLELGHTPIFLVGDFTARIGDPSGRNKTRPALDAEAVREHAATYVDQVARLLDVSKVEVRFNGEWMDSMSPSDFVRLCSQVTVARMLERDDFSKRYAGGQSIAIHEFLYPLCQGYDSVAMKADVELGGTDQKFNLLVGRELQRHYGVAPQCVLTMPLLEGLDGVNKMSKSLGNYIGIAEPAREIFGKLMSVSDDLMWRYYDLLSFRSSAEIARLREKVAGGRNPRDVKVLLAQEIVERFHDRRAAEEALEEFDARFRRGALPDDMPELVLQGESGGLAIVQVLKQSGLTASTSEAIRMIEQGGVRLDGDKIDDRGLIVPVGSKVVLQVGKRRFAAVEIV